MDNILQNYIDATNSHDFSQVLACLSDNAVYYFSNKSCTTPEQIKEYFESAWNSILEEKYWQTDVVWLHMGDESATCVYQFNYSGYMNGVFGQGRGRATNVFAKNASGSWELVHEHLSALPK